MKLAGPIIAILVLSGCATMDEGMLASPVPMQAPGDFTHAASGMVLPVEVDAFRRLKVTRYDIDGRDISAAYSRGLDGGLMAATVYIAPGPALAAERAQACDERFRREKDELLAFYGRAEEVKTTAPAPAVGEAPGSGRILTFAFDGAFEDRPARVRSQYRLYCVAGGAWFIEYRFQYSLVEDEAVMIEGFVLGTPVNLPRGS